MKFVIENLGIYNHEIVVSEFLGNVQLVARYPSRDQSTSLMSRKQALQLAAYLQAVAWSLDTPSEAD